MGNNIILGAGLLGSEIINQTGWDYLERKKDNFDFCNIQTYQDKLKNYDTIINCVGHCDTYSTDKDKHRMINYESVVQLSDFCENSGKKLIHFSTSYVYEYTKSNASEDDMPLISRNWYSYYKLLSDEYIMLKNKNHLIIRTCFKPKPFPYQYAWIDHFGNFDYVDIISETIIKLIKLNAVGLYNVGTEMKTMYELAKITKPDVKQSISPVYVPKDTTMNLNKQYLFLKNNERI